MALYAFDPSAGGDSPNVSNYVNNIVLPAATAKSVSVPSGATLALLTGEAAFYAAFTHSGASSNVIAVIPSADVADGTGTLFNPSSRNVRDIKSISLISRTAQVVTLEFYA